MTGFVCLDFLTPPSLLGKHSANTRQALAQLCPALPNPQRRAGWMRFRSHSWLRPVTTLGTVRCLLLRLVSFGFRREKKAAEKKNTASIFKYLERRRLKAKKANKGAEKEKKRMSRRWSTIINCKLVIDARRHASDFVQLFGFM